MNELMCVPPCPYPPYLRTLATSVEHRSVNRLARPVASPTPRTYALEASRAADDERTIAISRGGTRCPDTFCGRRIVPNTSGRTTEGFRIRGPQKLNTRKGSTDLVRSKGNTSAGPCAHGESRGRCRSFGYT